jgi:hypothetical protein
MNTHMSISGVVSPPIRAEDKRPPQQKLSDIGAKSPELECVRTSKAVATPRRSSRFKRINVATSTEINAETPRRSPRLAAVAVVAAVKTPSLMPSPVTPSSEKSTRLAKRRQGQRRRLAADDTERVVTQSKISPAGMLILSDSDSDCFANSPRTPVSYLLVYAKVGRSLRTLPWPFL